MTEQAFRPDIFFDGLWTGWGVSRDLLGHVRDRYTVTGSGASSNARRVFRLQEQYAFSDGRTDALDWEIGADEEGAFFGRDQISGVEGFGRQVGPDYIWSFKRPIPTALGPMSVDLRAHYSQVTAQEVVCITKLKRWGMTLATLYSCYRRA